MTTPDSEVPEPKESKIHSLAKHLWNRYISLHPLDFWLVTVPVASVLIFFLCRICIVLVTGGYVLPKDADDWGAWGTWIGGMATAAAFIYTAFQLRDQRINRAEDEAKLFASLKAKAQLIGATVGDPLKTNLFVAHPRDNPEMNTTLDGGARVLTVTNESDAAIQNVRVGLPRSFALPPTDGASRPKWITGSSVGYEIPREFDVRGFPDRATPVSSSTGLAQGMHFEVVQSSESLTCPLVFDNTGEKPSPVWIVFTDTSGYTWHRDLIAGTISQQSNHQN